MMGRKRPPDSRVVTPEVPPRPAKGTKPDLKNQDRTPVARAPWRSGSRRGKRPLGEPALDDAQGFGANLVRHLEFPVLQANAEGAHALAALAGTLDVDLRIAGAVEHQHGKLLVGGAFRQVVGEQLRQPGRERGETAKASRISQGELERHRAALADTAHEQTLPVDRIALESGVEPAEELGRAPPELVDVGRGAGDEAKPAVALHAGAHGHADLALRTEDERLAAQEMRRETEEIVRARPPAVKQHHGGKRAEAGGNVRGVEEIHGARGYQPGRALSAPDGRLRTRSQDTGTAGASGASSASPSYRTRSRNRPEGGAVQAAVFAAPRIGRAARKARKSSGEIPPP